VGRNALASVVRQATEFNVDLNHYQSLQEMAQQLSEQVRTIALGQEWVDQLYQKIAGWKTIILRPSLSHASVSGLLASQCCLCDKQELEGALKRLWESLFHASSLFYWQQQGIHWEALGLAVIIQPLPNAIASGILEVTQTQWEIQAVWGLGHSLVRGEVLPETYQINPVTRQSQGHQLGYQTRIYQLDCRDPSSLLKVSSPTEAAEKAVLTSEQLSALTNLAEQLTQTTHHGFRCEWVFVTQSDSNDSESQSKLYLTQFSVQDTPSTEVMVPEQPASKVIVKGIGAAKGRATGKVYVVEEEDDHQVFPAEGILVAKRVTIQNLPLIKSAGGLVTELGGITSHGAILARELKIPAVVGAEGAIEQLMGEDRVTIDGDQGQVLRLSEAGETAVPATADDRDVTQDNLALATQLMVNVSQRDRAQALSQYPVDGVGLLRSELMLLELLNEKPLSTWLSQPYRDEFIEQLANLIRDLADAFFPRPIFYRSTDWLSVQQRDTSLLGKRGTYRYLQDSEFFSAQMVALRHLQHQGYSNINLILPFVRDVEEVKFCQTFLTELGIADSCQVWIMAEVPSVVYLLPKYIEAGIDGIAIGTNDLTQLVLGVDREQGEFRDRYNERHPAVLAVLKALIEKAREGGIACSICGQGVVLYPELVDDLVRWGITTISVEESGIEPVYRAIARSEKRLLLEAARNQLNTET